MAKYSPVRGRSNMAGIRYNRTINDTNPYKSYEARTPDDYALEPHQAEMLDLLADKDRRKVKKVLGTEHAIRPKEHLHEARRPGLTEGRFVDHGNIGYASLRHAAAAIGVSQSYIEWLRDSGRIPEGTFVWNVRGECFFNVEKIFARLEAGVRRTDT